MDLVFFTPSVLIPACVHSRAVSVYCHTFWQLHHHRLTVIQVCFKIPAKLLGQVRFELLCSLTECAVYSRSDGKLEKVLCENMSNNLKDLSSETWQNNNLR